MKFSDMNVKGLVLAVLTMFFVGCGDDVDTSGGLLDTASSTDTTVEADVVEPGADTTVFPDTIPSEDVEPRDPDAGEGGEEDTASQEDAASQEEAASALDRFYPPERQCWWTAGPRAHSLLGSLMGGTRIPQTPGSWDLGPTIL